MKIALSSILGAATVTMLALSSSVQAAALPDKPTVEKRGIAGVNDFNCKLTAAHPRPLVLVHGTILTADSWSTFAPVLMKEGYCVFALTYGWYKGSIPLTGLARIEDSAQEFGVFADNILSKMNVTQIDYVGHSQGGIIGRYWMKYLGGAGKVKRMVGIAAINHGTTMNGLMGIFQMLNIVSPDESAVGSLAPSVPEMVQDSAFMKKLNDGGDTVPGVIHSNIVTMYDEIITPYESCFQHGAGVTNVVLQDLCMISFNEHLTIINSMVVLRFILNQLDPDTAKPANCFPRF